MRNSTNVTISGISIIRDLKQGNTTFNNKSYNIHVQTKYGCSTEHMNELVLNRERFRSEILIFSLGTINMKFDKPTDAFNKIIVLTDSLKLLYPNSKLVFTTIPSLNVQRIKPSIRQVNADVDEFNSRLLSLQDNIIDVIKVGYSNNMLLKDGIHLNHKGTTQLSLDIDEKI
ncbi:unnamed protein product [Didymodactylos carnosus]|uniref:SGNH hydrolase-type esterase domain-containing protein n=1 Tax=Didymodactylos carnosus TaxID=1234261 RepID=A0A814S977_9BILA|nr:unnamed protein product [Didymodactylos carnosus]CAF1145050.1 unnamed protein product [Didymodactylos carnosus]CAF3612402.1 unnamed protein product [Didymodactylos carnosus]CAF3908640.1 unnamed protein product [Didymodactylos carnosus]